MSTLSSVKKSVRRGKDAEAGVTWSRAWKRDHQLYLLLLLPVIYFIAFKYIPILGNVVAFRRFTIGDPIWGTKWVGFKYFEMFISDPYFWNVFKNTFILSFLNLIIGFPIPIIFALLLNEVRTAPAKRFVQTVSYLPRFFSTVVVVGMLKTILSPSTGIVNKMLGLFGIESIYFMTEASWFRFLYIASDIWQFMGWSAIIYIASLTNVDPELYQASYVDGANRWKQTLHITIPGIMPTIMITLILSSGHILSVGFEKVLLMYTPVIFDVADVLQTYVYRMGIVSNNVSYSTAIGLFQSVICLLMIWGVNFMSKKTTETSLW